MPYGLYSLAGAYRDESEARDAARALTEAHGLLPAQVALLAPGAASWGRFRTEFRQSPTSAGERRPLGGLWLLVPMGGVIVGLLTACAVVLADSLNARDELLTTGLAALAGAILVGAILLVARPQLDRRYRTFSRAVRRQLRARQWVLLVHDVPAVHQDAVVSLVRHRSIKWFAVSAEQRWL